MPRTDAVRSPRAARAGAHRAARRLLTATGLAVSIACAPAAAGGIAPRGADRGVVASFHGTVESHVAAIVGRDLERLLATVTAGDTLPVIFPEGQVIHTRQQYVAFHRAWFADTTWRMRMEPVSRVVRDGVGVALYRGTYSDARGERGQLVALTFAREDGEWRLVFDQNTRLPAETSR